MITGYDIQNAYVEFYSNMRNYIWDIEVVADIVDLEIKTFKAFPDIVNIQKCLSNLQYNISEILKEDEGLLKSFNKFKSILEDAEDIYSNLKTFSEVVVI